MRTSLFNSQLLVLVALLALTSQVYADPLLTSWDTSLSAKYARIYTSTANRSNGVSTTTWTGQTSPTYAGVHEIDYSSSWVYIKNTGLAGYVMGPWSNPNVPKNQGTSTKVYRFPRSPAGNASLALSGSNTGLAAIGFLVDGVSIYNTSDSFSYSNSHSQDATPLTGATFSGHGDGYWNRDALPNEGSSFDFALNHAQQAGEYHAHANPIGIRYLLGDNVIFNGTTGYSENISTTTFNHSPILGWINDGLPLYGPYGYDGGSTGATATATVSGGVVISVTVDSTGSLYQSVPAVTFSGGGGSGVSATALVSA